MTTPTELTPLATDVFQQQQEKKKKTMKKIESFKDLDEQTCIRTDCIIVAWAVFLLVLPFAVIATFLLALMGIITFLIGWRNWFIFLAVLAAFTFLVALCMTLAHPFVYGFYWIPCRKGTDTLSDDENV